MSLNPDSIPKALELHLQLSQYPILGRRIRERMRHELYIRGVITEEQFEEEVREKLERGDTPPDRRKKRRRRRGRKKGGTTDAGRGDAASKPEGRAPNP